jgi:hypothetical protein
VKISIRHQLSVGIEPGAARAALHLLMTPQDGPTQAVREWRLEAEGLDEASGFIDGFGNRAHLVTQTRPEGEIIVGVTGVVETIDKNGVVGRRRGDPVAGLFLRSTDLTKVSAKLTAGLAEAAGNRIGMLHALMAKVGEAAGKQTQSQNGQSQSQSQDASDVTALAHSFIGGARALGVPARFVTGYLAETPDGPAAFHAWAEAWDDSLGWIAFDPSLQLCPTDRHVRLASGLDAVSAAAVRTVPAAGTPQTLSLAVEEQQAS